MATKQRNSFISLFSSVQLALFLLFILALTSIIGTIIPQNSPSSFYIKQYGPQFARFIELLNLSDMYNSWWFLLLLLLFTINLTVCSIDRIPKVFSILKKDNLDTGYERLQKMSFSHAVNPNVEKEINEERTLAMLSSAGWKANKRSKENGVLFFAEKGGWTRFGVYIVHLSILVILAGAVIGSASFANKILKKQSFAFKGSVMIPETRQSSVIYPFKKGETIDLGFDIRCDYFTIEHYDNGMPKTFLSTLSILEDDKVVISRNIEVNSPLKYKGVTIYQSSYQPYQDFVVSLENTKDDTSTQMVMPPSQQREWEESGVVFGIINKEARGEVTRRVKVWFDDDQAEPSVFWLNVGQDAIIERPGTTYNLNVKQLYATGLQVTKDPGVLFVYGGCIFMLIGLYIAFFMSHQKIFVFLPATGSSKLLMLAGSTNKNKHGFEKRFLELTKTFSQ